MTAFLYALLTGVIWGIVPILEKLGLVHAPPFAGLMIRSLGVLAGVVLFSWIITPWAALKVVGPRAAGLLALGGFLASFVGQMTFYRAVKMGEVSRIVPVAGIYPLVAFLLGVLLLGESLTLQKSCGVLLVLAGVLLLR